MLWRQPGDKNYYLKQWWLEYRRIYASLGVSEFKWKLTTEYYERLTIWHFDFVNAWSMFHRYTLNIPIMIGLHVRSSTNWKYLIYDIPMGSILAMRNDAWWLTYGTSWIMAPYECIWHGYRKVCERRRIQCEYSLKHIDGLVQDCSNSIASALELLQSCTKPSLSSINASITSMSDTQCLAL